MNYSSTLENIQRLSPDLGGILSTADLANIIRGGSDLQNQRVIRKLIRDGVLFRIQRGIYSTKAPNLAWLPTRLNEKSYLSMDTILAKNGMIGTVPVGSVSAVATKRGRTIRTVAGLVRFFQIKPSLMFGTTRTSEGLLIADSEKAFLDLLYFYVKGAHFVIDPTQEVALDKLNRSRIFNYLKAYKNPKFVRFVKNLFKETP